MLDTDKLLYDLFQAYYDTRKHKRNTISSVAFEINYESKIFALRDDLVNGNYTISSSISFIIKDPVQREIFAAKFRDRVVHHLIYNYIYEVFDRYFIYDSYSCRLGKGTHFGVKRVLICLECLNYIIYFSHSIYDCLVDRILSCSIYKDIIAVLS